jgi:hypothetical protein
MKRWFGIASLTLGPLVLAALGARLEAQTTITANKGEKRLALQYLEHCEGTLSTTFQQLASAPITIPAAWTSGRIVARYSGESKCSGANYCSVQILVNGAAMSPNSGFDYAFDAPADPSFGSNFESNSVERTSGLLGPGTYNVVVQGGVVGTGELQVCGAVLAVSLWRVS